jgi:hypothetical protein
LTPVLLSCGSTELHPLIKGPATSGFAATVDGLDQLRHAVGLQQVTFVCPLLPGGLKASRHHPQAVTACVLMPKMA